MNNGTKSSWLLRRIPVTKGELDKLYPDGCFRIVGEVAAKGSRIDADAEASIADGAGGSRAVHPSGTFKGLWKTIGYLPLDGSEDEWVAVKADRRPMALGVAGMIVLAVAVIALALMLYENSAGPEIDPAAQKYKNPALDRPEGSGGGIVLPGYTVWELAEGSVDMAVPLMNVEGNDCYMQYTIELKDTGEVLYESKLIPPGEAIVEWRLSRPLPKGVHEVLIKIGNFDLNDHTQPYNAGMIENTIVVD